MIDNTALQPCPFCGGSRVIVATIPHEVGPETKQVTCFDCGASTKEFSLICDVEGWVHKRNTERAQDATDKAIAAWNRRAEPANEPLTIDQLRGMNGEPVWCVDAKGRGIWALVHTRDEVCTDADFGDWEFYCYGWRDGDKLNENGWLAYKGKPEGSER